MPLRRKKIEDEVAEAIAEPAAKPVSRETEVDPPPAPPTAKTVETTLTCQPWWHKDACLERAITRCNNRDIVNMSYIPGDPEKGTDAYVIVTERVP